MVVFDRSYAKTPEINVEAIVFTCYGAIALCYLDYRKVVPIVMDAEGSLFGNGSERITVFKNEVHRI